MGEPTIFVDSVASAARALEVPAANFDNGMNLGGSCAPGVGINMNEGAVVGDPEQFTLLDQGSLFGPVPPRIRNSQISQSIGGFPFVDRDTVDWPGSGGTPGTEPDGAIEFGDNPTQAAKDADPELDGTLAIISTASLVTLGHGWVAFVP